MSGCEPDFFLQPSHCFCGCFGMKHLFLVPGFLLILFACNNNADNTVVIDSNKTTTDTSIQYPGDTSNDADQPLPKLDKDYQNQQFGITMQLPEQWMAVETPSKNSYSFTTNIFPKGRGIEAKTPLHVHADAGFSYLAFLPQGLGTEFPSGETKTFKEKDPNLSLSFNVNRDKSRAFYLANGQPWGYFVVPSAPPSNWKEGFVFAQVAVNKFSSTCYDKNTGKEKPAQACDPLEGDRIVRTGELNAREHELIRQMLTSIDLKHQQSRSVSDLIKVEKPLANATVHSPLTIKGKARGPWYFEANFTIRLYDAKDKLLATAIATANGNWMTRDFVPFTAAMNFKAPNDERGKLVFEKANPSALEENAASYTVPVIFPPK